MLKPYRQSLYHCKKTGTNKQRLSIYVPEDTMQKLENWIAKNESKMTPGQAITDILSMVL
ncbi:hypothetical protein Gmet_3630 [Geobacter metallireducens GS-15]|uniref:Uncharacterized protein n=1 Tax=Geobacter metallireducens (strain ATCC 53774 / DSM 7210 / GS-15) TaxID=269799 RepID=J9JEP2_GEOMG|nr:hypothetical protein Gmet_3630 [Geobacter metallireducens GS-15]